MADHRIGDLIEPMDAVQRQTGKDDFVVFLVQLGPIYVEYDCQDEDKCPVKVFGAADLDLVNQIHGLLRPVSPELKHGCSPPVVESVFLCVHHTTK